MAAGVGTGYRPQLYQQGNQLEPGGSIRGKTYSSLLSVDNQTKIATTRKSRLSTLINARKTTGKSTTNKIRLRRVEAQATCRSARIS